MMKVKSRNGGRKRRKMQDSANNDSSQLTLDQVLQTLPPNEVIRFIFNRLSLRDRASCRQVSKLWNHLATQSLTLSPHLHDHSTKEVLAFGSTGARLERLFISKLQDFKYPADGLGFSSVEELYFIPYAKAITVSGIKVLYNGISEKNFKSLLKNYPDVKSLRFHSPAIRTEADRRSLTFIKTVKLNSLERLRISTCHKDGPGFTASGYFLKNTFPSLKSAHIVLSNEEVDLTAEPAYYQECYDFLARHASTLEEIALYHKHFVHDRFNLTYEGRPYQNNLPDAAYLETLSKIENVKVSKLGLELAHLEGLSRFQFATRLLKTQTHLKTLEISHIVKPTLGVFNMLPAVIRNNASTLETIKIFGCFCPANEDEIQTFSGLTVKNCHRLTVLSTQVCGLRITDLHCLPSQIKDLHLGQMLTQDQIDFISENMIQLESWKLSQGASPNEFQGIPIPKVIPTTFKKLLSLPNLTRLQLNKNHSSYSVIQRLIAYVPGISVIPADVNEEVNGGVVLRIDRRLFNWNIWIQYWS